VFGDVHGADVVETGLIVLGSDLFYFAKIVGVLDEPLALDLVERLPV
jgi:hypothetical protein